MDDYAENALRGKWARENWARLDLARQKMARALLVHDDAPARAVRTAWRQVSRTVPGPFDQPPAIPVGTLFGAGHPDDVLTDDNAPQSGLYYDTLTNILYELQG